MGVEKSLLFLLDEETGDLTLEAYHGVSAEFAAEVKTMKVGEGFNGRVAQTGEPLATTDSSASPALQTDAGVKENIQAQLIVPLKSKGRVLGTLCAATSEPRDFAAEEIGLASAIGNAIGVAIENARLYQKERETSEELRQSEENYRGLFENASRRRFRPRPPREDYRRQPGLRGACRLFARGAGQHGYHRLPGRGRPGDGEGDSEEATGRQGDGGAL